MLYELITKSKLVYLFYLKILKMTASYNNIALYDHFDSIYSNNNLQKLLYINGQNILEFTGKLIDKETIYSALNNISNGLIYLYSGFRYFASILYFYLMHIHDKFISNIYKFAFKYLYDDRFDLLVISFIVTFYMALLCIEFTNNIYKNNQKLDRDLKILQEYIESLEYNQKQMEINIEIRMKEIIQNNISLTEIIESSIVENQKEIDCFNKKLKKMDRTIKMYD